MADDRYSFQAEVSQLLDLMVHSIYSNKEIFLRELISNGSDACDRLRYAALTQPDLIGDNAAFALTLTVDKAARILTVADNGIGMNHDDMVENLGTIARSGTAAFVKQLSGEAKNDMALIGQFGVGFYSAFMVAKEVEVTSRKAGDTQAWCWRSDGKGEFTVNKAQMAERGTRVTLHLRDGEDEFLETARIRGIVKKYSDHIAIPIELAEPGKDAPEALNAASAIWVRPRNEISEDQYREFYHHVAHAFDDPWLTLHYKAEGKIEYAALLFLPTSKPFDLFHPDRKSRIKLYVRRVFITDDCDDLIPAYLRFLRGVVDSEDLPLNISREMLQHNPILAQIRNGIVRRVLSELESKADKAPEEFASFWSDFGPVLKEGLYEDPDQRQTLLKLVRCHSTASDGWVSLADYVSRMKGGQDNIYYIAGDDIGTLRNSPQLEGFAARDIEVLLFTDPVDEFWTPAVRTFDDKTFKSVTQGGADLDSFPVTNDTATAKESDGSEAMAAIDGLVALFKLTLGDAVKDVRGSVRLTDSPVCLVADESDMDLHLERLLKQHRQTERTSTRILEINPKHPLIRGLSRKMSEEGEGDTVAEVARLLLDQARIVEGEPLPDPAGFSRRMADLLGRGLFKNSAPA